MKVTSESERYSRLREAYREQMEILIPDTLSFLRRLDGVELGKLLDTAVCVKNGLPALLTEQLDASKEESCQVASWFNKPAMASEQDMTNLIAILVMLHGREENSQARSTFALQLWICFLGAITFPEQRLNGRMIWKELSRGFPFCRIFRVAEDIVQGLEPYDELIKHEIKHGQLPPNIERGMDSITKAVKFLLKIAISIGGFYIGCLIYWKLRN